MDLIIQIEIIRLILKNFRDSVKDITEQHYKMVISLSKKEAGKQVCLPGNICVERRYEYVRFKNQIADVVVPTKEKCELPYEGVVENSRKKFHKKTIRNGSIMITLRVVLNCVIRKKEISL